MFNTKYPPILPGLVAAAVGAVVLTFCQPAVAQEKTVMVFEKDGAKLTLFREQRMCVGAARYAEHQDASGRVGGCWIIAEGVVLVSFLDGERGNVPVGAFKQQEGA